MNLSAAPLALVVLLAVVAFSGCIFDEAEPMPRDPRIQGYDLAELERNFTRTTDLVVGLDDLDRPGGGLVVVEVVPEGDPGALRDVVWFQRPLDTPEPGDPHNFCGEFRSPSSTWGAATTRGALVVQGQAVPAGEVAYELPQPTRWDGVSFGGGHGSPLVPFFVLFGVDDAAAWRAAGADASYHVEGGAVWWRIVEEGTLRCVLQPSDHDEGQVVQNHGVTQATGLVTRFEAGPHAVLELLWRADALRVQVSHNGTELLRQTESGGGGRYLAPLQPGGYEVRYDDVRHVGGAAYVGFVLRDIDASLVPMAGSPYWSTQFD